MPRNEVTATVLIIGNEILSGRTQDLNLQFIARHLGTQGVSVREALVVPDEKTAIVAALNRIRNDFDYVLTTGGIGPTHDDITAECVAHAFGVPLVMNPDIEARIRKRKTTPDILNNRLRMALVPKGASLIENLTGGPQGFSIGNVYCMAGIPAILQAMLPTIQFQGGDIVHSYSVTVHVGETQISAQLAAIQDRYAEKVEIGSYPFARNDVYGTTLVMRGTKSDMLNRAFDELLDAIEQMGEKARDIRQE